MSTACVDRGPRLQPFLRPASIRLVGRLDTEDRPLGKLAVHLRKHGFSGAVEAVGDRVAQALIDGLGIIRVELEQQPPADLVVVAVRAERVPATIAGLGQAGHERAIVISSGFSEIGDGALEDELRVAARDSGVLVLGPNCQGIWNRNAGIAATFSEYLRLADPTVKGRVGVVSQSGAIGYCIAAMLDRSGAPAAVVASSGNEVDVTWTEVVAAVSQEPGVDVVLAYLEQVKAVDDMAWANDVVRANGARLAVLKGGRTRQGNHAAASHTAAVASDGVVLGHVCHDLGIAFARDLPDLVAAGLAPPPSRPSRRLAVVSTSGGAGVIAADLLAERGLQLAVLSPATQRTLAAALGPHAATANPVDVTAASAEDPTLVPGAWAALVDSGDVDETVIVVTMVTGERMSRTADLLVSELARRPGTPAPLVVLLAPPSVRADAMERLGRAGVPMLESLTPVANAVATACPGDPLPISTGGSRRRPPDSVAVVPSAEVLADLSTRGLPVVARVELDLADIEPRVLARAVPPPYVVKLVTADLHKAAAGNVDVGPHDGEHVAAVARNLMADRFGSQLPRVEVQHYSHAALEVFLGLRRDQVLGAVLTLGIGGRLAEPLRAMRHMRLPVDAQAVATRVADSLLGEVLAGLDPAVVVRLSELASEVAQYFMGRDDLAELDVNPVIVGSSGELTLVDAAGVQAPVPAAEKGGRSWPPW